MKYDHVVKVNGVVYPAGVEVPNGVKKAEVEQASAPAPKKEPTLVEGKHTNDKKKKDE